MGKVMISVPDDLLLDIDAEAKRRAVSRSELVRSALRKEIGKPTDEELDAAFARIRATAERMPAGDSAEWIRWDRDHGHSV